MKQWWTNLKEDGAIMVVNFAVLAVGVLAIPAATLAALVGSERTALVLLLASLGCDVVSLILDVVAAPR